MLDGIREELSGKRPSKPREFGLTMVLDKLDRPVNCISLSEKASYIDIVKVGWGLPLLTDDDQLKERIQNYQNYDIEVGFGGTLMELAIVHGRGRKLLEEAWNLGFSIAEISSGIIDIPLEERLDLADYARDQGFKVTFEVGKKDPYKRLTFKEMIHEVRSALKSSSIWKVIIEGREFGRSSCIFDDHGNLKLERFSVLVSLFDQRDLIFEAPLVKQQVMLIRHLGANVNLGNIRLEDVLPLESLRLGIRGDTFLIKADEETLTGSPSEKFVLYLLKQLGPMSTQEIRKRTNLPSRTVYKALKNLMRRGVVRQVNIGNRSLWIFTKRFKFPYESKEKIELS